MKEPYCRKIPDELSHQFYLDSPQKIAYNLLGCHIFKTTKSEKLLGRIVETEAYSEGDPACHAYRKKTERNSAMFKGGGHYYVYKIYGIHHCVNIVTGWENTPSAVLIRAIELYEYTKTGYYKIENNRLGAGPGKLCKILGIDTGINSDRILDHPSLKLVGRAPNPEIGSIIQTTRIGITRGMDLPWRWYLQNSKSVSVRNRFAEGAAEDSLRQP